MSPPAPALLTVAAVFASLTVQGYAGKAIAQSATVRVATFNVSLNRAAAGELVDDLRSGDSQARAVAQIVDQLSCCRPSKADIECCDTHSR